MWRSLTWVRVRSANRRTPAAPRAEDEGPKFQHLLLPTYLAIAIAGGAVTGCLHGTGEGVSNDVLLRGAGVAIHSGEGIGSVTEYFCPHGRYAISRGRIPLRGTYTLNNQRVCTTTLGSTYCRAAIFSAGDLIAWQDDGGIVRRARRSLAPNACT